jgi:hypothetical protein
VRLKQLLPLVLAALSVSPLVGCSRRAERLVGADRLARGPGGLGTTVRVAPIADRDTYVEPGTADFTDVLIVGTDTAFTARTFLAVAAWHIPSDTLPGFSLGVVSLELPRDTTLIDVGTVNAFTAASTWDTTTVAWPGPGLGLSIGSAQDLRSDPGAFSIPLTPAVFDSMKRWALAPTTAPGFVLDRPGQGLLSYKPGSALFRVRYAHTVSGNPVTDSLDSHVTQDFYLHSPISPVPTGTQQALVLGGIYKAALALHFPVDSVPAGVSIDEASLVLKVLVGGGPVGPDTLDHVEIRRIRAPWSESVTEKAPLLVDNATTASRLLRASYSSADSLITIPIPGGLIREWAATSSSNEGFYVSLVNPVNRRRIFPIGSRESALPPKIHISYTQLPPGRF